MAEVLVEYDSEFLGSDGRIYEARACTRPGESGLWEGWLEFTPRDGSPPIRTGRETSQPGRADVMYWATGLTATYIEGALDRALKPVLPSLGEKVVAATPAFDGPAEPLPAAPTLGANPVLDPFAVYASGADILAGQLNALDQGQLRNIIRAFRLSDMTVPELDALSKPELVGLVLNAVERRAS